MRSPGTLVVLCIVFSAFAVSGCGPSGTAVTIGQQHEGELSDSDNVLPDDDSYYDVWTLDAEAGQTYAITMTSTEFDPYLLLIEDGQAIAQNDDMAPDNLNSQVVHTFDTAGTYQIYANSFSAGETGSYTLTVELQ